MKWTKAQKKAIDTKGSDLLVAAAAGSGKTAVLVERIIQKVLASDPPVNIDELLVVTFTNAAAQEMRNRIGLALEQALEDHPTSHHLKKQRSLLQQASISTLHSFCMEVVRENAYLLDIDPAFRIASEMEADLMKQDVLDELLEQWYGEEGKKQEQFFAVVDRFSTDRSDRDVEALILDLYTFANQHPWPNQWLDRLVENYQIPENFKEEDLNWLQILKEDVDIQLDAILQEIDSALEIARDPDGPYHYVDALEADLENVKKAKASTSWQNLQAFMETSSFKRLSSKRVDCNDEKREKVKDIRNHYRKRWNELKETLFTRNLLGHIEDLREMAPVVEALVELVKQFATSYAQLKREKGLADFLDLEHYCLQLLIDESSTEDHIQPSPLARRYQRQFEEVLVDEYQDINLVQETILSLLSDQTKAGNRFMVGDVKQSIYRFRHAEPSLFIQKYETYEQENHPARRIDLSRNFRSRKHILQATNYIFRQILDVQVGEIEYDQAAELIYANTTYDTFALPEGEKTELLIVNRDSENEELQQYEPAQLEALAYVKKIKQWINSKQQVIDDKTNAPRDIQYRDIVILLRSMTWAPVIVEELKKHGIPVYAELATGYFEAIEIKVMLSLLKIIDNPFQDIPLAAVLRSPIVGLDEEELTKIRNADRHGAFYDALKAYIDQEGTTEELGEKLQRFMTQFETFRFEARQGSLSDLIWHIYQKTGYYDFVGGMPGGRQRQANLRALYDRARDYEATAFRGLFRFLRFIERMEERGEDLGAARALSEQEDVVRIMTIHSSKGLEFPAVILGGMDRPFNLQDLRAKYMLHKDLGFASKYIDPVQRITYPTLFYHAMKTKRLQEQLAEEMRVLYVALTRAKEHLVIVGNVKDFNKSLEKWQEYQTDPNWVLPTHVRSDARSYLDWILPALIRHRHASSLRLENDESNIAKEFYDDASLWEIQVVPGEALIDEEKKEEPVKEQELKVHIDAWQPLPVEDSDLKETVDERLSFTYPYRDAALSRAKQSVTEIKRHHTLTDEYSADQIRRSLQPAVFQRPKFMQREKTFTPAEIGTAMHTVMQHLPMTKPLTKEEIKDYLQAFVFREILTEEETKVINIASIEQFFHSPIADYIMKQDPIYREIPFSYGLRAKEVYPNWTHEQDEPVLIQGVIDCLVPFEDGWILLDYKTDAIYQDVTPSLKDQLIERYALQMKLYKQAIESIWQQPIKKIFLYFFDRSLALKVPFSKITKESFASKE